MKTSNRVLIRMELTRCKYREIYHRYLDLLKRENEENPLRAKHISKMYYARVIAKEMIPTMDPFYVIRIINNQLRKDDN